MKHDPESDTVGPQTDTAGTLGAPMFNPRRPEIPPSWRTERYGTLEYNIV